MITVVGGTVGSGKVVHKVIPGVPGAACGAKAERAWGWLGEEEYNAARINNTVMSACKKCAEYKPVIRFEKEA